MSSSIIEHFVLFKAKDGTDPSTLASLLTNTRSLISLDQVLHLTIGPILRHRPPEYTFTHMLHARYTSKEDLAAYSSHPRHQSIVKELNPICEDLMVIDWISNDLAGPVVVQSGSAMRVSFLKLKEGLEDAEKKYIFEILGGVKELFGSIDYISFGENFRLERSKGFSIASVAVFGALDEMDGLDLKQVVVNLQKEKVLDLTESVFVVDYVVPP